MSAIATTDSTATDAFAKGTLSWIPMTAATMWTRLGRVGAPELELTDSAYVAVENVVSDAKRDALIVTEPREPQVPQAQPGGEHDDRQQA